MSEPETVVLSLRLPEDLHAAAQKRAADEDRSLAALIRTALRRYLAEGLGQKA